MQIKDCPRCGSQKFVKHGIVKSRQRYLCKECSYRFTVPKLGKSIEKYYVVKALQLYLEGLGYRSIEKFLGISHVTVMNWVKKYGKSLEALQLKSNESELKEVDQLHSYEGSKKKVCEAGLLFTGVGNRSWVITRKPESEAAANIPIPKKRRKSRGMKTGE